jgi:hypothetical protein
MGGFLTSVFTSLFGWIATYFTKKLAYGTAVAASLLALTVAFYAAIHALASGLGGIVTNEWLLMGFYSCLPSNAITCMTAIFSAEILAFLYRHQMLTVRAISSAN